MTLYVATENAGKLREIRSIFGSALPGAEIFSVADLPLETKQRYDAEETGTTYAENALIKAQALRQLITGPAWILAEDSGFEVAQLNGAPGVYSARYAENDAARCAKILAALAETPTAKRGAQFVACMVLVDTGGNPHYFYGRKTGYVAPAVSGGKGFGYDPIFCPEAGGLTWAQLGDAEKNKDSHRARALAAVIEFLRDVSNSGAGL